MLDTGIKILVVSSEAAPFSKTGGLADVAGSLPKALLLQGNDVRLVTPRYRSVSGVETLTDFPIAVGSRRETVIVRTSSIEAKSSQGKAYVPVYLLDNYHYFDRDHYYAYQDDGERFAFFDLACIELCERLDFIPDVIHCNDWQTGFIPLLVRNREKVNPVWSRTATCFTIHNLKYQGNFGKDILRILGVGDEYYNIDGVEYYGQVSFLKAGINFADVVNTVSVTYSREIQTPEFGEGFDGILRRRKDVLFGIVNGINFHEFNPASDPRIYRTYDSTDLAGKKENKYGLQRELGLLVGDRPLAGIVSRLVDQKGLDLVLDSVPEMISRGMQFVLLGTGDQYYEDKFRELAKRYPDSMAAVIGFNGVLAQRIYAGSDMFLMPSKFEPCGLGQLIAMRYGSIPIVRSTGGLADTVMDYDNVTSSGNGFVFREYTSQGLMGAIKRALTVFGDPDAWQRLVKRAMEMDFSWNKSAALYTELYIEAMSRRGRLDKPNTDQLERDISS